MATRSFLAPSRASKARLGIGLLAPAWVPVPPPSYGGIEQVVATLATGLAARGHEVSLVAPPGSSVPGVTLTSPLTELPAVIGEPVADWRHALTGLDAFEGVDIVIDHSGPLGALLTSHLSAPGLHVTHGPLDALPAEIYEGIARHSPSLRLVAISDAQRALAPGLPFAGMCHNGLVVDEVPFRARSDGYLAFLGRMSPEKGPADAIRIAGEAGIPLMIAAKCREPDELEYFERHVAPALGPEVTWLGEIDAPAKYALLGGARALLFPIAWPEPFGMVMIEAMACGTPVLATSRGSVNEVVADGLTGFVRATPEGLVECVARIDEISRKNCRRRVAERFSADSMTVSYERLIRNELEARGRKARGRLNTLTRTSGWIPENTSVPLAKRSARRRPGNRVGASTWREPEPRMR